MKPLPSELKSTLSLSGIFALRMLSVFMLVPIFSIYANKLNHATPALAGIAMGIYGLTQAIFQIPLGIWSDKIGRKPVITAGLLLFGLGSLLGATAHNIWLLIVARALQGAGAVGSTIIALLADVTSEKNRTKAMAVIGIAMGISSAAAIILGPAIASLWGFSGVFLSGAFLTLGSLLVLHSSFNNITENSLHFDKFQLRYLVSSALKQPALLKLDFSIFALHAIFTAMFYTMPFLLKPILNNAATLYLPILLIAFILLFPCIFLAEKYKKMALAVRCSIVLILISQFMLAMFHPTLTLVSILVTLFFIGFNFLEAALPSLVSKTASTEAKGTAMGFYSSAQFLGIFIGGTLAGTFYPIVGIEGIFYITSFLAILWLFIGGYRYAQPNT